MTISICRASTLAVNKIQEHSFVKTALYLSKRVFTHSQVYNTLASVRKVNYTKVKLENIKER
jgi:ribosomal protein L20A (L18A)